MGELIVRQRPELNSPYMVIGFGGWPNAGEVATAAVSYLRDRLGATRFAEITPEEFYDFTSLRPLIVVEEGLVRWLRLASNEFYFWRNPAGEHDLILLLGFEPQLRWGRYAGFILQIAQQWGVKRLYSVGGVYDRVPHTKEPPVSAVVNYARLKQELVPLGMSWTDYQGPSSFHSVLLMACRERRLEMASIWGHTPIYVQAVKNPKVCHAVLSRLAPLLGLSLDLSDLRQAGEHMDETLSRMLSQNDELRRYVEKFEQEYEQQGAGPPRRSPLASDRIIREIEEFLRQEQRGRGDGSPG
jgi:proteasome assembly chaperone (PAC2) family protein